MWMVEKIRVSLERTNLALPGAEYNFKLREDDEPTMKNTKVTLCPNVITPNTIPKFCIPPTIHSQQEHQVADRRKSPSPKPPHRGAAETFSTHIIQVEPVDEACSDEESTNADPQSQAALSLPHLAKAQTCYGFSTLLESPHTRRKESLFHGDPNSAIVLPKSRANGLMRAPSFSTTSLSLNSLTRFSSRGLSLVRQGTLDSDTTSSTESSPFSSPLLVRSTPRSSLFKTLSQEKLLTRKAKRIGSSRNDSLSTEDGSSTDNSPNILRRASEGLLEPPTSIFPTDLTFYRERVLHKTLVPLGREGILRLSAEYCLENQRLCVRLVSAEGLYKDSVEPRTINCSVSLSLMPGKAQKQRSTVIRKSRNPIFNEDFFFDGISQEDLCCKSLRFKVVNKVSTMKRDCILGDCEIPLQNILSL